MSKSKADQTKEGIESTILFNILKGTTFLYKGVTNCSFRKLGRCNKYADILAQCAGYALDDKYGDACKVVSDLSRSIRSWGPFLERPGNLSGPKSNS